MVVQETPARVGKSAASNAQGHAEGSIITAPSIEPPHTLTTEAYSTGISGKVSLRSLRWNGLFGITSPLL